MIIYESIIGDEKNFCKEDEDSSGCIYTFRDSKIRIDSRVFHLKI